MEPMSEKSKSQIAFERKVLYAALIDQGVDQTPSIAKETGDPIRTISKALSGLRDYGIVCEHVGGNRFGRYVIKSWGFVSRSEALRHLKAYREGHL